MTQPEDRDLATLTDNDLALAFKAGHPLAFEEIVRRFQARMYAVAYRITLNREDALDATQESFVKAYRKIDAWQPTGGFLPWLLRLTSNHSIDLLRRRSRRRHESLDDSSGAGPAHREPATRDTEQRLRAQEIDERIRGALVALSPTQRTVFTLRHYEGLQLAEIAEVLGCTVGSVKVHLFRSLRKLQKELGDLRYGTD